MKIPFYRFTQLAFFVLVELLLLFGTTFSKFQIIEPVHLFDLLLFVLAVISLWGIRKKESILIPKSLFLLIAISVVYLVLSIFLTRPFEYILRQYALFGYLSITWLIFASFISKGTHHLNVRFIGIIAVSSIIIQIGYLLYLSVSNGSFLPYDGYNYFSRLGIIGVIASFSFILVYVEKLWIKIPLIIFTFLIATTMGYSSVFLSGFLVVALYLFLKSTSLFRWALIVTVSISIILFIIFIPEFADSHAQWRMIFWKVSIKEILFDKVGFIGHGFGIQYASDEVRSALMSGLKSSDSILSSNAFFVTPMHNGFITMAFHVGLLPSLLLLVPLKNAAQYILSQRSQQDPVSNFLVLTLLGASVWVSFNVVLELPHSSIFYWLIYFTVVYHFQNRTSTRENQGILLITNAYPSSQKPYAGIFVKNQFEYLKTQELNIEIFFMKRRFTTGISSLLKYVVAFIRFTPHYFKQHAIIHVHFLSPLILLAYIFKQIHPKSQLVLTSHGSDIAMVRTGGSISKIYKLLLQSFDNVIVVGSDQKQTMADKFGLTVGHVLPAGIDEGVFKKDDSISKSNDFIFVGSFTELKGLDNLIKAIRILNDKEVSYTFVGSGPLSKEIEQLKNDGFHVSIRYNLNQMQISELFNSTRWSILPSRSDAFGLVVSESMYCGTPVIVSPLSSLKQQVDDGRNGIILNENDPESLSDIMRKVASMSKDEYLKYSDNAVNSNQQYRLSNVCNELKKIYSND